MRRLAASILFILIVVPPTHADAQQSRERNLQTCLSGRYPTLCNYGLLTAEQLTQAKAAERNENLRVCLSGKYPALCKHSMLSPEETTSVRRAERTENLRVCSTGKYPALCRQDLLTAEELRRVGEAEAEENLRICMDGRYAALCRKQLLTYDQSRQVAAAEADARTRPAPRPGGGRPASGDCESGHWIEAVEGGGKVIKLEDGSLWEVDDIDTVTTSIWLSLSEVVVCGGKMTSIDDGESVEVTPIGGTRGRTGAGTIPTRGYVIEASANDETFVINGEVFKAKTYCFGFDTGDRVQFVSGSALGACASATLLHLGNGKVCEVWCE